VKLHIVVVAVDIDAVAAACGVCFTSQLFMFTTDFFGLSM